MRPPLNAGEDLRDGRCLVGYPTSFNEAPAECGGRHGDGEGNS